MLDGKEIEAIAQDHVSKTYPAGCEILYREQHLKPDGTYFEANRHTDNILDQLVGAGGFFVSRESGEIWLIPANIGQRSGHRIQLHEWIDYWLQWYKEGWREGWYRLTVREVKHPHRFARLLVEQHLSYRMRELENNWVWSRDIEYDEALVQHRIAELPCTFLINVNRLRALIPVLQTGGGVVFDYSYVGNPPGKYVPTDQLGPQYE